MFLVAADVLMNVLLVTVSWSFSQCFSSFLMFEQMLSSKHRWDLEGEHIC